MSFFITGANGFLGTHLVSKLISQGESVVIYSRKQKQKIQHLFPKGDITYIKGELYSINDMVNGMKNCKGIFHLAGSVVHSRTGNSPNYPKDLYETNVDYSVNIIKAAAKANVKRVVIASTSGVIGCRKRNNTLNNILQFLSLGEEKGELPNDDSPYCKEIVKNWPYYHSKILAEERTLAAGIQNGVEVIWMRPSMLIGPGDINFRSIKVIMSYLHQSTPIIPNGVISVVDVRDVANAFITAMKKGTPYRGYSLSALSCTLKDFYNILDSLSNVPPPKYSHIPDCIVINGAKYIDKYNRCWKGNWNDMYDPVRAEMSSCDWTIDPIHSITDLNFIPRDVHESLEETIEWIYENEKIPSKL